MREKSIILTAKVISLIFMPFYMPILAFVLLFIFSYMSLMPFVYKLIMLSIVALFSIVIPRILIYLYIKLNGLKQRHLSKRETRTMPYLLSIISYWFGYELLMNIHTPRFMISIFWAALAVQIVCGVINLKFRISTHSAAVGSFNGMLIAYSLIFAFDPLWWLCLSLVITGVVASSRVILRQHTVAEVNVGMLVGVICGFVCGILI